MEKSLSFKCPQDDILDEYNMPFLSGMLTAFDCGGVLHVMKYPGSKHKDDFEALRSDWYMIGRDLWGAMVAFDEVLGVKIIPEGSRLQDASAKR